MKLKIPFYQTTWSGISLVDLAKKLEHPLEKLPDARFYDAYYKKISNRKSLLNKKWKLSKKKITQWLKEQIDMHGNCKSHIISIGAGTGIIEIPLIESGYTIDLQEYQEESLDIFEVRNLTTCYVKDLKTIEGINYDIAVVIAMTYALSDKELELFFESCAKILGKNGKLIILDTSLSWWEIYAYCRNKSYYKKTQLRWGLKRSISSFKRKSRDFIFLSKEYYDDKMTKLVVKTFMGVPYNLTPHWQMMVFQKND